ncbi:MAG: DUF4129 domain-containing protein [Armatimonadetes bacterium]|nr:DUF4129 domain-containing protein [Armatimonadota bacterium]
MAHEPSVDAGQSGAGRSQRAGKMIEGPTARNVLILLWLTVAFCLFVPLCAKHIPTEQQVRDAVARVLARPEFREPSQTLSQRLIAALGRAFARITEWLLRPLQWLVERISSATDSFSPFGRWITIAALTFLLVLLLVHILYLFAGSLDDKRCHRRREPEAEASDPKTLLLEARRLAESGQYREATSALYLGALLLLDRAGLLTYNPSVTNWAYAEALAGREEISVAFRALTEIADRALYSPKPVSSADFATAERLLGRLEGAIA